MNIWHLTQPKSFFFEFRVVSSFHDISAPSFIAVWIEMWLHALCASLKSTNWWATYDIYWYILWSMEFEHVQHCSNWIITGFKVSCEMFRLQEAPVPPKHTSVGGTSLWLHMLWSAAMFRPNVWRINPELKHSQCFTISDFFYRMWRVSFCFKQYCSILFVSFCLCFQSCTGSFLSNLATLPVRAFWSLKFWIFHHGIMKEIFEMPSASADTMFRYAWLVTNEHQGQPT